MTKCLVWNDAELALTATSFALQARRSSSSRRHSRAAALASSCRRQQPALMKCLV